MKLRALSVLVVLVVSVLLTACDEAPPVTSPPGPNPPSQPDLVLTDIVLKPRPANYGTDDDVIVNTVVRNNGAAANQGFSVWCSYSCNGNAQFFSAMKATNGLPANQEITLGDDSLLSLSSCSFEAQREFTCIVDNDKLVAESDESNNELTETLLTGR